MSPFLNPRAASSSGSGMKAATSFEVDFDQALESVQVLLVELKSFVYQLL